MADLGSAGPPGSTHPGESFANQALTFGLELAVYGAVVVWALGVVAGPVQRALLAVGAVVGLAVVWGLFAAPKASMPVHGWARVGFEVAWFGAGAAALWFSGHRTAAVVFAVLFAVNGGLRIAAAA